MWTRWAAMTAAVALTSGCVAAYRTTIGAGRYSVVSRPHSSYYCYDCHGYRFFDPYYDWCTYYGFRYRWAQHPRAMAVYRERYVRIRENHPEYGRYQYRGDYRGSRRYRQERDYETWQRRRHDDDGDRGRSEVRREKRDLSPKDEGRKRSKKPERHERRPRGERFLRLEGRAT